MTDRAKDVQNIRKLARRIAQPHVKDLVGGCIYLSAATIFYMARVYGNRSIYLQAGSASFPRIRPEQDDGVMPTHFSYVFDLKYEKTIQMLLAGNLPEMHAWCYDARSKCFIDLSVGFQQEACKRMTGMDWPGDPLPDFVWHKVEEMPKGIYYRPDVSAVLIAEKGVKQTMDMNEVRKFLQEGKV